MKLSLAEKIVQTIHTKPSKPIGLCLCVIIIVSTISIFATAPVQGAGTPAIHTSGVNILDEGGNVVYLRGVGVAGFAPNLIFWGEGGKDAWSDQWNYNPTTVMDQTFSALQSQWHVNMIRVFVYPSWYYRDNIAPSQEDPSYAAQTTPISTRTYLRTLCQEADKYGIYVNIVPYMLTPSSSSSANDPYATDSFGWQGLPMMGWDDAGTKFLTDAGYGNNEQAFWNWFWTDMANNLKDYPNAIFEAWNEPGWNGGDTEPIPTGYMTYLQTMYSAIRGTGASNLIFMQWRVGWNPNGYGSTLSWASDINSKLHPTNVAYTTHFYYYSPTDLSGYWAKDYSTLKTQVQTAINSMGVTAPLVINEEGSCTSSSPNKQNDYTWWQNLILAQRDLGVGACAYYWLSDSGLGTVFSGETMLTTGYTPNTMGQTYISAYNGAPTTPSPTIKPTATPSATPTTSPTANPTTAPTPTSTQPALTNPTINPLTGKYWLMPVPADQSTGKVTQTENANGVTGYIPGDCYGAYPTIANKNGYPYWDLRETPYLSFDIYVDEFWQGDLQDHTGLSVIVLDATNNGWNPSEESACDLSTTYGHAVTLRDGSIMRVADSTAPTHYTIDLRTLNVPLNHVSQLIWSLRPGMKGIPCNYQITNVQLSSSSQLSDPQPTATPTPAPTATPTPKPTATQTPKPTVTPTPTPTATPTPSPKPSATPSPEPTATPKPTETSKPTPTATAQPTPTQSPTKAPTTTPKPTSTPTLKPATFNFFNFWWPWQAFIWTHLNSWAVFS
jgi:hypothetical protein